MEKGDLAPLAGRIHLFKLTLETIPGFYHHIN